jgi:hypothetical protein
MKMVAYGAYGGPIKRAVRKHLNSHELTSRFVTEHTVYDGWLYSRSSAARTGTDLPRWLQVPFAIAAAKTLA